jgi:hypothetical protein
MDHKVSFAEVAGSVRALHAAQQHEPAHRNVSPVPSQPSVGLRSLGLTAAEDIIGGLSKAYLWGRLGWLDVKRRYRRALLGPFWTSISLAVLRHCGGAVGAGLWHKDIGEYLPLLISGMVAWLLAPTITTEACGLLVSRPPRFEKTGVGDARARMFCHPGGGPIDVRRLKYENTRVAR